MTIQARPTIYRGIRMRSRLEATVAAVFDKDQDRGLLVSWEYEPVAFGGRGGQYLPDFCVVDRIGRYYVEVRPTIERALLAMPQMAVIWESEPGVQLMVLVPWTGFYLSKGGRWRWHRLGGPA